MGSEWFMCAAPAVAKIDASSYLLVSFTLDRAQERGSGWEASALVGDTRVVLRNRRVQVYLVVGLVAAGLIGYSEWQNSDAQRLKRCVDAAISQMKQDAPGLEAFDEAQPALEAMSRASCVRLLEINPRD